MRNLLRESLPEFLGGLVLAIVLTIFGGLGYVRTAICIGEVVSIAFVIWIIKAKKKSQIHPSQSLHRFGQRIRYGAIACLSVVTVVCMYSFIHVNTEHKRNLEEPTFVEKSENVIFSLGGIDIEYSPSDLKNMSRIVPFDFGGYKFGQVYIKDGKLYSDFKIYAGKDKSPVEIRRNNFIVRVPNWDRNSNAKALEVVNENQAPVFQFIYATPYHIVIKGIFPSPAGLILADDKGIRFADPSLPIHFPLQRIFKYPSWKYPGEYE